MYCRASPHPEAFAECWASLAKCVAPLRSMSLGQRPTVANGFAWSDDDARPTHQRQKYLQYSDIESQRGYGEHRVASVKTRPALHRCKHIDYRTMFDFDPFGLAG